MKKILIVILLLALMLPGISQEVLYTNQLDVAWDPVTALEDGSPIPVEDSIYYEIVIATKGSPSVYTVVGNSAVASYSVSFTREGEYIVGVRTVRYIASANEEFRSTINWSDENGSWTPDPFAARYFMLPGIPANLRLQ